MKYISIFLLLMLAVTYVIYGQVNLNDGLVGYYKMDEGEGDTTVNSAQGDNVAPDGVLMNEPFWDVGKYGSGLWFTSSTTQLVSLGTFDPTAGTDELSVSVFLNWGGTDGGWHGIIGKRDGWNVGQIKWDLCLDSGTGCIQFETNTASGKVAVVTPEPPLIDEWQHIGLTFDGTVATFYMDGDEVIADTMEFGLGDTCSFSFGNATANGSSSDAFSGGLDELRIYNRVLTPEEILTLATEEPTAIEQPSKTIVEEYCLAQNYPNPFNPSTTIRYSLQKIQDVQLTVFDITGKEIATLVNTTQNAGEYSIEFNGKDLSSGVYFYQLKTNSRIITKKMLLTK